MAAHYTARAVGLLVLCCPILFLTSICVVMRVVSRRMKSLSLGLDDYWIFVALFFAFGNGLPNIIGVVASGVGQDESELSGAQIKLTKQLLFVQEVTWALGITAVKLSLLCLYNRVFPLRSFHLASYTLMAVVGLFCIGTILSTVLQCRPIEAIWDQGLPAVCENQNAGTLGTGIGNFLTDVIVLALPIPSVWRLKLPRTTRVALMSLFGVGFIVCIISVFRIIYISTGVQFLDITYSKVPTDIYSILELTLGIICACLPIMRPIISKALPIFHSRGSISLGDEPAPPPPPPKRSFSRGLRLPNDDGGYSLAEIGKSREPQGKVSGTVVKESAGVINVTREWDVERQ